MKASCNGCSLPSCAKPSIVKTERPRTSKASVVHALTGRPSTNRVQAPQTSTSQDRFAPVSPNWSRTTSRSNSCGSTSISCNRPFKVNDTGIHCVSECLVIALAMNTPRRILRPLSRERALKSPLQEHAHDMFFIFLRAVQIADRLSRASRSRARLGDMAQRFVLTFAFE